MSAAGALGLRKGAFLPGRLVHLSGSQISGILYHPQPTQDPQGLLNHTSYAFSCLYTLACTVR